MTQDIHITRDHRHINGAGRAGITEAQWTRYVRSDPEMSFVDDGSVVRHAASGTLFHLQDGVVTVYGADDEQIRLVVDVGDALGAYVRSDDLTTYTLDVNGYLTSLEYRPTVKERLASGVSRVREDSTEPVARPRWLQESEA